MTSSPAGGRAFHGVAVETSNAADTASVAVSLVPVVPPGAVVVLTGDLGAGKTTFVRAFCEATGVEDRVTSPTFTLMHHYDVPGAGPVRRINHVDAYRLTTLAEVDDLGLAELMDDSSISFVEWGEGIAARLPSECLRIRFEFSADADASPDCRTLVVDAPRSMRDVAAALEARQNAEPGDDGSAADGPSC